MHCELIAQDASSTEQTLQSSLQHARNQGDMTLADSLAAELLELAKKNADPSWQAEAFYEQARNSMERNKYDESAELLNQSIELFQSVGERKRLGDAYRQLGLTFRYQSNYSTALEYIYLAMQIYQDIGDKHAISSTYNSIGIVMEKMGQFEEASEAHNQALQLHYELDNQQGIASALYNIGDIYRSMGDFDKALRYLQDSLKMDIAAGDPKYIAYSLNKLGYMLNQMGRRAEAREHLLQALSLFQQIEAPRDTDWAWASIAQLELDEGNIDTASEIIEGVIARAIDNKYKSLLVDAYFVAIKIAMHRKQFNRAIELIDLGIVQAIENDEANEVAKFEALRVEAFVSNDSIEEAFNALKRQKELSEAILDTQRIDTIARMQAQSDFVRQAQHIKILENETALQQADIERKQLSMRLWIISVVAISILGVLVYGRMNQIKLNKRLSQQVLERTEELQAKNTELSTAYTHMEALSMSDKLTGIKNRHFLEKVINTDVFQALRKYEDWKKGAGDKPFDADIMFFMLDLDNFKHVNDKYGHIIGDQVLQEFVHRMQHVFRQSDYLVRWGGEEFVAVARFVNASSAPILAERIREQVESTPFLSSTNTPLSLTCSIGFCCISKNPLNMDTAWNKAFAIADASAYIVKYSGKNGWFGATNISPDLDLNDNINTDTIQQWDKNQQIDIQTSLKSNQIKWTQS